MKIKKTKTRKMLIAAIIVLTASSGLFAQGNSQNNSNGLWYAIDGDTVTTNREVLITKNLKVQGSITADSIRVRKIKVGNNSLILGGTTPISGNDEITSTNPAIAFGRDIITGLPFSDIQIGIGTTTPLAGMMLDVNGNINTSNATNGYFINDNEVLKYHGASGTANTSNIFVGIGAGNSNTAGAANTANGMQALFNNTTGNYNIANGVRALFYNTEGSSNTANGYQAGGLNT